MRRPAILALLTICTQSPHWGQGTSVAPRPVSNPSGKEGVVRIASKSAEPGTGFVVQIRGGKAYIVTAAHVVEGDKTPAVEFGADPEARRYDHGVEVRDLEGGDERGLALITVDSPPSSAGVLGPAGRKPEELLKVAISGYPVRIGVFTAKSAEISAIRGRDLILSAMAEAGFSGGPVLFDGAVIGMVYGRGESGVALVAASIRPYLEGLGVEWGTTELAGEGPQPRRPGDSYVNPKDGLTYKWMPAGRFRMGCSPGDSTCDDDETPAHWVEITRAFWMGESEVTQAAWKKVMKTEPSGFKGGDFPVEQVGWDEARRYCAAIGGRLPTEAEWEYAARAGTVTARYGELDRVAWYSGNSGNGNNPVKQKDPNAWGLYDMLGNVYEWNEDWYGNYQPAAAKDPKGPPDGAYRVVRGGSSVNSDWRARASDRDNGRPGLRGGNIGFRCAGEFP